MWWWEITQRPLEEKWSGAQCSFAIKMFYEIDFSLKAVQHLFCVHYHLQHLDPVTFADATKPWVWVCNFEESDSSLKRSFQVELETSVHQKTSQLSGPQNSAH
jgi:hypothetical protein